MKRAITFRLVRAALAACLYAAAVLSAHAGAPAEKADRRAGDGTPRAVSGKTLMTPEALALLKEQVRRSSAPADAGPGAGRTR